MANQVAHESTWYESVSLPQYSKLTAETTTDVVIVGGGMAGLLSAYMLAQAGKSVVILEAKRILSGATSLTTAFLTQSIDTDVSDLVQQYGDAKTKLIWQSHGRAIDLLEKIIQTERIACDFGRTSYYIYAKTDKEFDGLRNEYDAMNGLGFNVALHKTIDAGFANVGALEIKNQAKFHPLKFAAGLLPKLEHLNVRIFEQTKVDQLSDDHGVTAHIGNYQVRAAYGITASYDPLNNPKQTFLKKGMYVSYVYEVRVLKGTIREAMYEDMSNPYHYIRLDSEAASYDRMIVGGEDNRQEIAVSEQKNFRALEAYVQEIMGKRPYKIVRQWSGPILEPSDGLALIGMYEPHQLIATAFSGNGMTYSAIAALLFRDLIMGKANKLIDIYDPKRALTPRTVLAKVRDYTGEFFGAAVKNIVYLFRKH
jgi:glycine/D-amino acid oxidase-like deaminating enzyme